MHWVAEREKAFLLICSIYYELLCRSYLNAAILFSGWYLLEMWQIPNVHPNPTESGTFPEIWNPSDT